METDLLDEEIEPLPVQNATNATTGLPGSGSKSGASKASLSAECGECLAMVGQAIWNCGTLEMECIKNTIELGSECLGSIKDRFTFVGML